MSSTPRETPGDAPAASGSASRPGAEVRFDQVAPLPANPGPARKTEQGTLYLIPVPLGPDQDPRENLPPATLAVIAGLECFIVENAKSARAVLRRLPLACPRQATETAYRLKFAAALRPDLHPVGFAVKFADILALNDEIIVRLCLLVDGLRLLRGGLLGMKCRAQRHGGGD